jgi:hypothetical protein
LAQKQARRKTVSKAKNGGTWKQIAVHELRVLQRCYRVWKERKVNAQLRLIGRKKMVVAVWRAAVEQPLVVNGRSTGLTEIFRLGAHTTKKEAMAACRRHQRELLDKKSG